ncbi:MAG: DNA-processing protein DprA [Elusimicrobiota bacterium]|jgi:DNA processing protein|nr:DNA-processing protein DprA [Elusimicrobiota bacterium]
MPLTFDEKAALLKINSFSYLRADWLGRLLDIFGSGQEILKQDAKTLSEEGKVSLGTAQHFLKSATEFDAEAEFENIQKANAKVVFKGEEGYPETLLAIKEPPLALYIRGVLDTSPNAAAVAMVGTRKITPYGRRVATKLAEDLTNSAVILVSGLARGVDSLVHAAAVRSQNPTWALIGTGIGRCYPAENKELARAILDNGGAIISELPFNSPPLAQHFPRRNRLIAGLSRLVVVVEGEVKSGALITAKMALEQGLDVLSVPGPIDSPQSNGTNKLIREGAAMVMDARDIIDALPLNSKLGLNTKKLYSEENPPEQEFTEQEAKVLSLIGQETKTIDDMAQALKIEISELAGILFNLEVNGVLICADGQYAKKKF